MRIAHVDAESGFSGGEKQVLLLMRGLSAAGVEGVLVSPPGSQAAERAGALGLATEAVAMRADLDLGAVRALARAFRRHEAQLVHLHTGRAAWLGGLAARLAGLPAVVTRRMDRPVRRGAKTRLLYEHLARRTVAISEGVAACLREGGVRVDRVIPSAVDPAELAPRRARGAVRDELGALPDDFVVLAPGALVRRKGHDVLIEAVRRLGRPPRLWIAGEGDERPALERALGNLAGRGRLLGRRADVPDLMAAADLVAMPSRAEGLGVAALEALAAGRPLVASRVGGLAELVVDGVCGVLVPPDDPAALAAALERLRDDPDLRARLARAGPARVAEGFLAEQMVAAYLELYRELLNP